MKRIIILMLFVPTALFAQRYGSGVSSTQAATIAKDSTGWQKGSGIVYLLTAGDSVGVGTSSPLAKLYVSSSSARAMTVYGNGVHPIFKLQSSLNTDTLSLSTAGGIANVRSNNAIGIYVQGVEYLRIDGYNGTVTFYKPLRSQSAIESTGVGLASLGSNSPATTLSAPFKWIQWQFSDGSTGWVPVWK